MGCTEATTWHLGLSDKWPKWPILFILILVDNDDPPNWSNSIIFVWIALVNHRNWGCHLFRETHFSWGGLLEIDQADTLVLGAGRVGWVRDGQSYDCQVPTTWSSLSSSCTELACGLMMSEGVHNPTDVGWFWHWWFELHRPCILHI